MFLIKSKKVNILLKSMRQLRCLTISIKLIAPHLCMDLCEHVVEVEMCGRTTQHLTELGDVPRSVVKIPKRRLTQGRGKAKQEISLVGNNRFAVASDSRPLVSPLTATSLDEEQLWLPSQARTPASTEPLSEVIELHSLAVTSVDLPFNSVRENRADKAIVPRMVSQSDALKDSGNVGT